MGDCNSEWSNSSHRQSSALSPADVCSSLTIPSPASTLTDPTLCSLNQSENESLQALTVDDTETLAQSNDGRKSLVLATVEDVSAGIYQNRLPAVEIIAPGNSTSSAHSLPKQLHQTPIRTHAPRFNPPRPLPPTPDSASRRDHADNSLSNVVLIARQETDDNGHDIPTSTSPPPSTEPTDVDPSRPASSSLIQNPDVQEPHPVVPYISTVPSTPLSTSPPPFPPPPPPQLLLSPQIHGPYATFPEEYGSVLTLHDLQTNSTYIPFSLGKDHWRQYTHPNGSLYWTCPSRQIVMDEFPGPDTVHTLHTLLAEFENMDDNDQWELNMSKGGNLLELFEQIDRARSNIQSKLELESRYWMFVQTHPNHVTIPEDADHDAKNAILWCYADRRQFESSHAPFEKDTAQEMFSILQILSSRSVITLKTWFVAAIMRSVSQERTASRYGTSDFSIDLLIVLFFVTVAMLSLQHPTWKAGVVIFSSILYGIVAPLMVMLIISCPRGRIVSNDRDAYFNYANRMKRSHHFLAVILSLPVALTLCGMLWFTFSPISLASLTLSTTNVNSEDVLCICFLCALLGVVVIVVWFFLAQLALRRNKCIRRSNLPLIEHHAASSPPKRAGCPDAIRMMTVNSSTPSTILGSGASQVRRDVYHPYTFLPLDSGFVSGPHPFMPQGIDVDVDLGDREGSRGFHAQPVSRLAYHPPIARPLTRVAPATSFEAGAVYHPPNVYRRHDAEFRTTRVPPAIPPVTQTLHRMPSLLSLPSSHSSISVARPPAFPPTTATQIPYESVMPSVIPTPSHPVGCETLSEGKAPLVADLVFVHGLCGDRRGTWTKNDVCWPEELLSKEEAFSHVRILTFGYDANIVRPMGHASLNSLFEHSINLLTGLSRERRQNASDRPIIFVAHCLGGVLVKDALNLSEDAKETKPHIAQVVSATRGIIFLGTPHRGSSLTSLANLVASVARVALQGLHKNLAWDLETNSQVLDRIGDSFGRLLDKRTFTVWSFMEELPMVGGDKVVHGESAVIGDARENRETIYSDHVGLTKFLTRDDSGYKKIRYAIEMVLEELLKQESLPSSHPIPSPSTPFTGLREYLDWQLEKAKEILDFPPLSSSWRIVLWNTVSVMAFVAPFSYLKRIINIGHSNGINTIRWQAFLKNFCAEWTDSNLLSVVLVSVTVAMLSLQHPTWMAEMAGFYSIPCAIVATLMGMLIIPCPRGHIVSNGHAAH